MSYSFVCRKCENAEIEIIGDKQLGYLCESCANEKNWFPAEEDD